MRHIKWLPLAACALIVALAYSLPATAKTTQKPTITGCGKHSLVVRDDSIIRVAGNGCVNAYNHSIVIAHGNVVVSLHDNASAVVYDNVVVVIHHIYNHIVKHGANITVICDCSVL